MMTMVLFLLIMARDLRGVLNWCRTFEPGSYNFEEIQTCPVGDIQNPTTLHHCMFTFPKNDVQKITSILAYMFLPFPRNRVFKPRVELFHLLLKKSKHEDSLEIR